MMETVRKQIIALLEEQPRGVRDLSQSLGVSEKDVYGHLEHVRRSLAGQGKRFQMTPGQCLSCGYVFRDRSRPKKPGRCPKCRQTHIRGSMFHIE